MSSISLIFSSPFDLCVHHNVFEGNACKYILTGVDVASNYNVLRTLKLMKASEAAFVLKARSKKWSVIKYRKVFHCDNGFELNSNLTKLFKNIMLIFEEQQQNTSTPIQSLWRLSNLG